MDMNMIGYFYNLAGQIARDIAKHPYADRNSIYRKYGVNPKDLTERDISYINELINDVYLP